MSLPHCHLCYLNGGSCKFPQLIVIFRVIKGYICLVGENYLVANLLRLGFLDQQICVPLLIDCSLVKDFPQSLDSGSPILIKLVLWSVLDFCMIQSACNCHLECKPFYMPIGALVFFCMSHRQTAYGVCHIACCSK